MANLNASAAGPTNIDNIYTTTANAISKGIAENRFNEFPTLKKLMASCEKVDGGDYIVESLSYGFNNTRGFFGDYATMSTTPNQFLTQATYSPVIAAVSISISSLEEAKNSGKAQRYNLLKQKIENAHKSKEELMNQALYSTAPSGLEPISIPEIVSASNPSRGNLGGIDRSANSWWQGNQITGVGSFASGGIASLNTGVTTAASSSGSKEPDWYVTTKAIYNHYRNSLEDQVRYVSHDEGNSGFKSLKHNGATIVWDPDVPTGTLYQLNLSTIKMKVYSFANFKQTPFVKPANGLSRTAQIFTVYNIVTNEPRRNVEQSGITA